MNKSMLMQQIKSYLFTLKQWYLETPERALDEAYKTALLIKAMEDKNFNGKKIVAESASYGDSVMAYFQSELKKYLKTTRMRLAEFEASRSMVSTFNQKIPQIAKNNTTNYAKIYLSIQLINNPDLILEKLRFIDSVVAKYRYYEEASFYLFTEPQVIQNEPNITVTNQPKTQIDKLDKKEVNKAEETSIVPRYILSTLNRIRSECDPKSEQELIKKFRIYRRKTLIFIRFIIMLILVPFLTYFLSK